MLMRRFSRSVFVSVGVLAVGCAPCFAIGTTESASQSYSEKHSLEQGADDDATPDLVEVFSCRFDAGNWDVNYDRWPDRWTRLRDEEHPGYVRMQIEESQDEVPENRLVIYPDGASASTLSPPIHVMPKFSYLLSLKLKIAGVRYGKVYVRMAFLDPEGRPHQVDTYGPVAVTGDWLDLHLPPHQPKDKEIDRLVVHIDFERGQRSDLEAAISVTDLSLARSPSIRIHTDSEYNVYTDAKDVKVTCTLSGILESNPEIRFQLLDASNKQIGAQGVLELDGEVISESTTHASDIVDGLNSEFDVYEGSIDWHPPITDYGFYRVRVQMISSETGRIMDDPAITLAVVRSDLERSDYGEFGWSLPHADKPLSFSVLQELLPLAGVNKVKTPVWFAPDDEKRGDAFVRFADQLAVRRIETIGVLEDPNVRIADPFSLEPSSPIEGLLSADSTHWLPLIDHVITKLSLRIHWWQLGRDGDTSFVGYGGLIDKIFAVRNEMFRFGQDVRIGLGWRWDHTRQWDKLLTWDFEQMSGRESTDASELDKRLREAPKTTADRWVLVEPPQFPSKEMEIGSEEDADRHRRRIRDFVEQIIVAKVRGVDGIFIANPFAGLADPKAEQYGVMNVDGTPGELLLPWRTCARLLGGAEFIGSVVLPKGSQNWIFRRTDGKIVMAIWNHSPTQETLYLGEEVHLIDIWGKTRRAKTSDGRQSIAVDRMPQFVIGLNESVARWRMATRFKMEKIPSIFAVAHPNALIVLNEFPQGVGGTVRLFVPSAGAEGDEVKGKDWQITPEKGRLSLAAGAQFQMPFETMLKEAGFGDQPIRIDFSLKADKDYQFSVWRKIHVGQGSLRLDITSEITPEGRLVILQEMSSSTGRPSDFKCSLYAPPARRKRAQIFQLGAEVDKKTYTYLDGRSMIGNEMKLRIEEVDGNRVLIRRFIVQPRERPEVLDGAVNLTLENQPEATSGKFSKKGKVVEGS